MEAAASIVILVPVKGRARATIVTLQDINSAIPVLERVTFMTQEITRRTDALVVMDEVKYAATGAIFIIERAV